MDRLSVESQTLTPLPDVLRHGLVAISTFAILSFFLSTSLFLWLTYQLLNWRRKSMIKLPTNQFLLLVYNLVIADMQQSLAFVLNIHSLREDAIDVGHPTCWAQGWFISTGDLASSLFVLAIAVHTFLAVIKDYKLSQRNLWITIALIWTFNYTMTLAGILHHPTDYYVRAGAWCWVNVNYQSGRLWFHYFWIFVCMFLTFIIYITIYAVVSIRNRSSSLSAQPAHALPLMILYPSIYTVCTTPLAAGRLASMSGQHVSLAYFCVAGSMIACNGWLDTLLYAWTRRGIVFGEPTIEDLGLDTFLFGGQGSRGMGTITTIQGGIERKSEERRGRAGRRRLSTSSTENFFEEPGKEIEAARIKTETTVHISVASATDLEVYEMHVRKAGRSASRGLRTENNVHVDKESWDTNSASFDHI